MFKPIPLRSLCKPLPLFAATILLVVIYFWFGLALVEVQSGQAGIRLRTGGWFYLGIPIILGFGLVGGLATTFVARKFGQRPVWIVLVPLSVYLAYGGATRDFPERQLPLILGIDAKSTQVLEYRVFDSFNDGDMTVGVLQPLSHDVFVSIIKDRELSTEVETSRPMFREDEYSRGLPTASNRRLTIWYNADEQRLYFRYHNRLHRGGRTEM